MDFHEEPACLQLTKTTYIPLHTHMHTHTHTHTHLWALGSYLNLKNNTQFWFLEFWGKQNSDFSFLKISESKILQFWLFEKHSEPKILWFQLFFKENTESKNIWFQFFFLQKVSKNRQFSQNNWQITDKFIKGYLTSSQIFWELWFYFRIGPQIFENCNYILEPVICFFRERVVI
jgi:hypothetical protein